MNSKHECTPEKAATFREWLASRGGVAVWRSVNMSNLGASWSTPALTEDGKLFPRPSWDAGMAPERVITDLADIDIVTRREVKRFRVALRRSSTGLYMKLTDASSRKLREVMDKAGEGAAYRFDYEAQQAVISVPAERVPLDQWIARAAS